MKKVCLTLVLLLPAIAAAQVTWNQTAFNAQTTATCTSPFRNVNQSSHWLTFTSGAFTTGGTIYLQGSADNTNYITISNIGVLQSNGAGFVQAGGYYPEVRACIAGLTGGSPSVSATYSASTGVIPTPGNAGYATNVPLVTFVPIPYFGATSTLKSTGYELSSSANNVFYGATVYNPNAGVVYVAYAGDNTPFVGGGAGVYMIPVGAGQTAAVTLPPQGLSFFNGNGLFVGCSTSPTSAVDPASACVVTSYWKQVASGIVPN